MAKKGLREWVNEKWVKHLSKAIIHDLMVRFIMWQKSKGEKRKKYPKCVPLSKARKMSPSQRSASVKRKQSKDNTSKGKPGYAKT